eukprot:6174211-Pleurochrysis_carterae.AAC.2
MQPTRARKLRMFANQNVRNHDAESRALREREAEWRGPQEEGWAGRRRNVRERMGNWKGGRRSERSPSYNRVNLAACVCANFRWSE